MTGRDGGDERPGRQIVSEHPNHPERRGEVQRTWLNRGLMAQCQKRARGGVMMVRLEKMMNQVRREGKEGEQEDRRTESADDPLPPHSTSSARQPAHRGVPLVQYRATMPYVTIWD